MLAPRSANVGLGEALKLVLAASTLNMVLPSKIGDLSKAYFMRNKGHMTGPAALGVVLFEKLCDVLSLRGIALIGDEGYEALAALEREAARLGYPALA